jgi:hypothetical protein
MPDLIPVGDVEKMAIAIAKSGLFGVKNPEQAMALMLIAQAEGYHPAIAARDYHVIQGRPTLKADAMLARFQSSGGKVEWREYSDERVTGVFSHPQGGSIAVTWEIAQAKRIGLYKPGSGWEKYPRAMLRARVISEAIRTVYPGCIAGSYTPEEVSDFVPPEKDITPVATLPSDTVTVSEDEVGHVEAPSLNLELHVPGKEGVYATLDTVEDYSSAMCKMADRIRNSEKIPQDEKAAKIQELKELNKGTFKKMGLANMTRVLQAVSKAGEELGKSQDSEE